YMTCGMLDRHDEDVMVETAACKLFCSHFGWHVIDEVMQMMGGEGYMTEHELERSWRDNRIHRIVEGSNEVMQSFIFAYGGKQLAEQMLSIQEALSWDDDVPAGDNVMRILANALDLRVLRRAVPLAAQLFLGVRPPAPDITGAHSNLSRFSARLARMIQRHAQYFKLVSKWHREKIVQRQAPQARIADNAVILFALSASLARMDLQLRSNSRGAEFERDKAAFEHLFDLFEMDFYRNLGELRQNADESMRKAARFARQHNDTLPNERFYIHEASPVAAGEGRTIQSESIRQFPGDRYRAGGDGASPGESQSDTPPVPDAKSTSK
ncbi:MAG: acyl-CoA dehydrogenase family protein, partial [Bacteroidota bacterium]